MSKIMQEMGRLSSAEEFLDFFGVEYEQCVVNVHRLHILKRFRQYLACHVSGGNVEKEIKAEYRALLERAYADFVRSNARTEKVFKVFQDASGVKTFSVDSLRASLPGRR